MSDVLQKALRHHPKQGSQLRSLIKNDHKPIILKGASNLPECCPPYKKKILKTLEDIYKYLGIL
jgi:hypothetical protein